VARRTVTRRAVDGAASPLDITNGKIARWFIADSLEDILSDGASVDYWRDESQYQQHVAQISTNRPTLHYDVLNGHSVVRFDGTNHFMGGVAPGVIPAITQHSLFIVCKYDSATFGDFDGLVGGGSGDDEVLIGDSGTTAYREVTQNNTTRINNVDTPDAGSSLNTFHLIDITDNSFTWAANFRIGQDRATTTRRWDGDIAEIILFDTALGDGDRLTVRNYLNDKYLIY
jgi:hypothetical protein